MVKSKIIMGMPIILEIGDAGAKKEEFEKIFAYFESVDRRFSTYKPESEIMQINRGKLQEKDWSGDMKEIFRLAEETKTESQGFFDIKRPDGQIDPSGIVKGWAIWNAAKILQKDGIKNFYLDAGGDIQVGGKNKDGKKWRIGILNPFNPKEIVQVAHLQNEGLATSGNYIRGDHIYNPKNKSRVSGIVSLSVIGPNIYEADRFATAAFAMGQEGIKFIEGFPGLEGYLINKSGLGFMTSGFHKYTEQHA